MERLFAYGTLQNPEVCRGLIGRNPESAPAELCGYERRAVRGESYPAILPNPHASVRGRVLHSLSHDEMAVLDDYEGDEYERIRVEVRGQGGVMEVWTYIWTGRSDALEQKEGC